MLRLTEQLLSTGELKPRSTSVGHGLDPARQAQEVLSLCFRGDGLRSIRDLPKVTKRVFVCAGI